MPTVVIDRMFELSRSLAVRVCVPTVKSVTFIVARPLFIVVEDGVTPAGSVVVRRTRSPLLTWLNQLSVAETVTENGVPEIWLDGVPVRPVGVAGAGDWPGSTISSRLKLPARTSKPPLVPSLFGKLVSHA